MRKRLGSFVKTHWSLLLVIVVSLVVFLTNLSGNWYTLDEPNTVTVGKSIGLYGFPSGWDGHSLVSDNNGREFKVFKNDYRWTWQPPLQFYLAYLPIPAFGDNPGVTRMPFALLGVVTVLFFYLTAEELFRKRWLSSLLSIQLIFLSPFFLYVRQVRYYSPAMCFSLIMLYVSVKIWNRKWRWTDTLLFTLANTLLFLTNYLVWVSSFLLITLIVIMRRNKQAFFSLVGVGIFATGWYVIMKPYGGDPIHGYLHHFQLTRPLLSYISYMHMYVLPFFLLPFLLLVKKQRILLTIILVWIGVKLIFYSLLLPPHGRYMADLFPVCLLVTGFISNACAEKKWFVPLAGMSIFLLLVANPGILLSKQLFKGQFHLLTTPKIYAQELTTSYPSFFPVLSTFMHQTYKEGGLYWSNNYHWAIVEATHIPMISTVCIDGKFRGPASVTDPRKIKWFIFFQNDSRLPQNLNNEPCLEPIWQEILEKDYKKTVMKIPQNTYLVNDPDIVNRQFPPRPMNLGDVIIYQKK